MTNSQDPNVKTAGKGTFKVSMLRGSDFTRSLRGKSIRPRFLAALKTDFFSFSETFAGVGVTQSL